MNTKPELIPFPLLGEKDIKTIIEARMHQGAIIDWYLEAGQSLPELHLKPYAIPLDKLFEVHKSLDRLIKKYTTKTSTIFELAESQINTKKKRNIKKIKRRRKS